MLDLNQKLPTRFRVDPENLKTMFMQLLASAMDHREPNTVHPSFVRIVQQLSSDEATLFNKTLDLISPNRSQPIVSLRVKTTGQQGFHEVSKHIAMLADDKGKPSLEENFPFWMDNWQRLGVVEIRYDIFLEPKNKSYAWVKDRPEYLNIDSKLKEGQTIEIVHGLFRLTAFGMKLAAVLK